MYKEIGYLWNINGSQTLSNEISLGWIMCFRGHPVTTLMHICTSCERKASVISIQ